ncbi:3-deoxy-D-manno-octulosonate 8-phosphate phosphatase [Christensenellaceae bacterium NSJ-63]|uniref:3-deoxy-D-manno-octulosonate 8-phosphate phosphatase n=2 Tax=Guopingia tenuis TaxID=2763656 RepID=A0A926DGN1_9FIRM|nr:3-deoxy-D-manno-octulosonate 8-phosphate phosphatase [Guopingia tenuis]
MKKVKYLIMDVDGTLTDGKIYMSGHGEAYKAFNIKDGYGIHDIAIPAGIIPVIITGRSSDIVLQRGSELGIKDIYQGVIDKIEKMQSVAPDLSKVAYIGDDINDLSCMLLIKEAGGLVGCPKNAARQVIEVSDYIADHNGGEGAVRDFIEWLLDESQ